MLHRIMQRALHRVFGGHCSPLEVLVGHLQIVLGGHRRRVPPTNDTRRAAAATDRTVSVVKVLQRPAFACHPEVGKKPPRGEVVLCSDEVDVHLNPKIGLDWMNRGQQKEVVTPEKNEKRMAEIEDEAARARRKPTPSARKVGSVILSILETTPPGEIAWSTRSMAKAQKISRLAVQRIWNTVEMKPYLLETLKLVQDLDSLRNSGMVWVFSWTLLIVPRCCA